MRVFVLNQEDQLLLNAVLLEGRTYGRIADLLDSLSYEWKWQKPNKLYVQEPEPVDVLGAGTNNVRLSEHFRLREFQCRHCHAVIIEPELVRRLQTLRTRLGKPVTITSGYRCPTHNRAVRGSNNSYHLTGMAVDIRKVDGMAPLVYEIFADGGIGDYRSYFHVDIGPLRRWEG